MNSNSTHDFLNMEFAFKYDILELLWHEYIPETQDLAAIRTVYNYI